MSFVKTAHEIADELGNHADEVKDDAKKVANQARGGIVDLGVQLLRFANRMMAFEEKSVQSALSHIGLQKKESIFRPLGYVAAGAIAGGAIVLFLAPTSGKEVRLRLSRFFDDEVTGRVKSVASDVQHFAADARETAGKLGEKAQGAVKNEVARAERNNGPHS